MEYIKNYPQFLTAVIKFVKYIEYEDGKRNVKTFDKINFTDVQGFLGESEVYKRSIPGKALEAWNKKNWTKKVLDANGLCKYAAEVIDEKIQTNLVDRRHVALFKKNLTAPVSATFFKLYMNDRNYEPEVFEEIVNSFGSHYDIVSYLFFIKDSNRFLPIRPTHFDYSCSVLGIDFNSSGNCTWDNYQHCNAIIAEVRNKLENVLDADSPITMIDAHSFMWILSTKNFKKWETTLSDEDKTSIEMQAEGFSNQPPTERKVRVSHVYTRSKKFSDYVKTLANGICQLCEQKAPFITDDGVPYLESHHIKWVSQEGPDVVTNMIALCPNCHRKMHILNKPEDVKKLAGIAKLHHIDN